MMPIEVIDYVLVHELAHLKILNHSKSFWELVGTILPDFKNRKLLLKEYGKKLNFP
jgi:predicted metal-dependent hydrolase